MKLSQFFLVEETHGIDPEWTRSIIRRYDPGVGGILSTVGTVAQVLRGSSNTVWKLTDSTEEADVAERIMGKRTRTLVPVIQVIRLDDNPPEDEFSHVEGPLSLVQTEMLQDVDPLTRVAALFLDNFGQIHSAAAAGKSWQPRNPRHTVEYMAETIGADPAALQKRIQSFSEWMSRCTDEARSYGLSEPDILGGQDNVKVDRHGSLRLIDLG